jgi:peptidoglycan/LPS O-acetylase OafA/YrhL
VRLQYRPHHRADIEGLRAIAVLLVVAFHAGVPGFRGGYVGVDVFFVLSGYLITWLLVDEAARTGGVDLQRFYARRARRLLPAVGVLLLATLAVSAALYAPFEQRPLARTWAATALYVSNLDFARRALDYHGARAGANPLLHMWSLSVEEQFYFVWPWLVLVGLGVLGSPRRTEAPATRLPLVLGVATALSFALSLYLTRAAGGWAFYLSPARAWEFGAGGLAVLIPVSPPPRPVSPAPRLTATRHLPGWLALLGLGAAAARFDRTTPFPGLAAVLPVLSTVVLLRCGSRAAPGDGSPATLLLARGPLQTIGRLSYSWYLWHWPTLVVAAALVDELPLGGRLVAVATSLGVAYLSYRFVEAPVRQSRWLAALPRRSLGMAAAITAAGVAVAAGWSRASASWGASATQARITRVAGELPAIYADGCDDFGHGGVRECVYGDRASRRVAVLVGDSHAGQWFPALADAAARAGHRLVVLTLSACPFVELPPMFNETLGRPYPECVVWRRSAVAAIGRLRPAITFVASATEYDLAPAAWEAGTRAVLAELVRSSERVVLVLDPPAAGFDVPACLARAAWRVGDALDPACRPRGNRNAAPFGAAQARAARATGGVEVLDLRDEVCVIGACAATAGGLVRYRDAQHLSVEFARTFGGVFSELLGQGPRGPAGDHVTRSRPAAEPRR